MGTFSPPAKLLTPEMEERVRREMLDPFIAGLARDGLDYRGMLFPGLMITADGPKVLEFNCRFGDPETQVLLTRLESDLVELLEATIDGRLAEVSAKWKTESAVCVVLASGGYPGSYATRQSRSPGSIASRTTSPFSTRAHGATADTSSPPADASSASPRWPAISRRLANGPTPRVERHRLRGPAVPARYCSERPERLASLHL